MIFLRFVFVLLVVTLLFSPAAAAAAEEEEEEEEKKDEGGGRINSRGDGLFAPFSSLDSGGGGGRMIACPRTLKEVLRLGLSLILGKDLSGYSIYIAERDPFTQAPKKIGVKMDGRYKIVMSGAAKKNLFLIAVAVFVVAIAGGGGHAIVATPKFIFGWYFFRVEWEMANLNSRESSLRKLKYPGTRAGN